MQIFSANYSSPLGNLELCCNDTAITSVLFVEKPSVTTSGEHPLLEACVEQLTAYFTGKLQSFDLPLQQRGTEFQQKAWHLLNSIPFGKTVSYMQMARQYGDVKAIRALASANGKNKISIIVPCHRVIGSNQSLTGYAGGLWRKKWLLEHESKYTSGLQTLF